MDGPKTTTIADQIDPLMPDLRRYAQYLSDTPEQSEVLIQKAILRILTRKAQKPVENLRKYLFSILHNLHNDSLREKQNRQGHVNLEDVVLIDPALSPNQRQTCQDVLRKISALPRDQRDIFAYLLNDNLSYSEISAALNIPEGTVMSRLSRARKALRKSMDMQPDDTIAALLGA